MKQFNELGIEIEARDDFEGSAPVYFSPSFFTTIFLLFFVTAELRMDVLREKEVKDSLERQLQDEQKIRGKSLMNTKFPSLMSR